MVLNALREYYGASIGVSGERQKFLRLLQNENESITSWERRVRNQAAQCEYENFADELTRDQFIAGLTSEALRVKLIGKGHRHRDTPQTKVTLREVFEVDKAFEATTFANKLMKTARGTQEEQVNFTSKSTSASQGPGSTPPLCYWCRGSHQQPRQQHCPAFGKRCNRCGITGHFARACREGTRRQGRHQQSNFIEDDTGEEVFAADCETAPQHGRKFFANLHLIQGGKTKVVKAQIDTASTCNTMPSSLLNELLPDAKISKTRSKSNTYGSETMRPKGQVTLFCDRKEKIHMINFLVVDLPYNKPPLLCGKDAQALDYWKIYADETHTVEEKTPQTLAPLGKLTKEDVLEHYLNVFKPGHGKPLGTPMHNSLLIPVFLLYTLQRAAFLLQSWKE